MRPEAAQLLPKAFQYSPSFGISAVHNLGTQSSQQHLCGAVLVINSGRKEGLSAGPKEIILRQVTAPYNRAAAEEKTYTAQCKGVKGFPSRYENGLCSSNNSRQSSCPEYKEKSMAMEEMAGFLYLSCAVPEPSSHFQILSYNPSFSSPHAHPCICQRLWRTSVGGPVHGRVSAVIHPGIQGVCGKGSLQQRP